eukprot:UN04112
MVVYFNGLLCLLLGSSQIPFLFFLSPSCFLFTLKCLHFVCFRSLSFFLSLTTHTFLVDKPYAFIPFFFCIFFFLYHVGYIIISSSIVVITSN